MEEEEHHVVLGEELGHCRQLVGSDLDAAPVDLVFLFRLPELVGPAEGVVGGENGGRQGLEQPLERLSGLRCECHLEGWVVGPEYAGQHALREVRGQRPRVLAPLPRQLLALGHGNGNSRLRLDQELVLRQKAGEEHAVPVLVGDLMGEAIDFLRAARTIPHVAELPAVGAQASSQGPLFY